MLHKHFTKNPFIANPCDEEISHIFFLRPCLQRVLKAYDLSVVGRFPTHENLLIWGGSGMGKTILLRYLYMKYSKTHHTIWLDKMETNTTKFLKQVLTTIHDANILPLMRDRNAYTEATRIMNNIETYTPIELPSRFNTLIELITTHIELPFIVFLDETSAVSKKTESAESLRSTLNTQLFHNKFSFVFSMLPKTYNYLLRDSFLERFAFKVVIPPFTPSELWELLNLRITNSFNKTKDTTPQGKYPFTDKAFELLCELVGGNPRKAIILSRTAFDNASTSGKKNITHKTLADSLYPAFPDLNRPITELINHLPQLHQKIVLYVDKHTKVSHKDLMEHLGVSSPLLTYHISRLTEDTEESYPLLTRHQEGRQAYYTLSEEVRLEIEI